MKEEQLKLDELVETLEVLDPLKNVQDLAAHAAEILAKEDIPTTWDDILKLLEKDNVSEKLKLASHIIFRASLILEVLESSKLSSEGSELNNLVYNTMLMMNAVQEADIRGYFKNSSKINYRRVIGNTSSMKSAVKKEKIINTIRELARKNPEKKITWLRKKASITLSKKGERGYSYRQVLRDTKGIRIKK